MKDLEWLNIFINYYEKKFKENILINKNEKGFYTNPLYIGYKITERCNQCCKHCWAGKSTNTHSYIEIIEAINKLEVLKPYLFAFTGGEPFIREDFLNILEYSVPKFPVIEILTNGTLLTEDIIRKLSHILKKNDVVHVSLDGLRSAYLKQRQSDDFFKVVKNIKYLKKYNINVRVHMTITEINVDDMVDVYKLCRKIQVDHFSVNFVYPLRKGVKYFDKSIMNKYLHNISLIKKYNIKSTFDFKYFIPWIKASENASPSYNLFTYYFNDDILHWTIDGDGNIYNYMDYFKHEELNVGNIYENSVEELMSNNRKVQKRILYRDLSNENCKFCNMLATCGGGNIMSVYPTINKKAEGCKFEYKI